MRWHACCPPALAPSNVNIILASYTPTSCRGAAAGEAFRDNGRVQVEGPQLAELLWQRTGLQRLFDGLSVEGATAVGLNSNLRFYR